MSDMLDSVVTLSYYYRTELSALKAKILEFQHENDPLKAAQEDLLMSDKLLQTLIQLEKLQNVDSIIDDFDFDDESEHRLKVVAQYDSEDWAHRADVDTLLSKISKSKACIVRLYHGVEKKGIDPMSFRQIGEIFGVSKESIRQQYHRAMKQLKEIVE